MEKIIKLINKLNNIILERNEELETNKIKKRKLLDERYNLIVDKKQTDLNLINNNYKKEMEKHKHKLTASFLSSLATIMVAFVSFILCNAIIKLPLLESLLISLTVDLVVSPLIIYNEFKEYRKLNKGLKSSLLENIDKSIEEEKQHNLLISKKLSLIDDKVKNIDDKNLKIKNELEGLKVDLNLLNSIKKQVIDKSFQDNNELKQMLDIIYKEKIASLDVEKGNQKTKK